MTPYVYQEYPRWKYHWTRPPVIVQNSEQEAALGGGWANTPDAFLPYQGPRQIRKDGDDPLKWVNQWPVCGLSSDHRRKISVQLLRAHAAFWKAPDGSSADVDAMRMAFVGIAEVLLDAGLLTEPLLQSEIGQLVWDAAIAGGWWRFASEARQDIFSEQLGRYWVWRDDRRDWQTLFRAETAECRAKLLEVGSRQSKTANSSGQPEQPIESTPAPQQPNRPGKQARVSDFEKVRSEIRELKKAGFAQAAICERLGSKPRPPNAAWNRLLWPDAFRHRDYRNSVKSWISSL